MIHTLANIVDLIIGSILVVRGIYKSDLKMAGIGYVLLAIVGNSK